MRMPFDKTAISNKNIYFASSSSDEFIPIRYDGGAVMNIYSPNNLNSIKVAAMEHLQMMFSVSKSTTYPKTCSEVPPHYKDMLNVQIFSIEILHSAQPAAIVQDLQDEISVVQVNPWLKPHIPKLLSYGVASQYVLDEYDQPKTLFTLIRIIEQDYRSFIIPRGSMKSQLAHQLVDKLNAAVSAYRSELIESKAHLDIRKKRIAVQGQIKSTEKYVTYLISVHETLQIVKIQLGFKPEEHIFLKNFFPMELKEEFHSDQFFKMFKKYLNNLMQNNRFNKIMNLVIGYISKIGHGPKQGFYADILFFLDGNTHFDLKDLIASITQRWFRITQGKGCVYEDKCMHLDDVHHSDKPKQNELFNFIKRLFIPDLFFKYKPLSGNRTLQISRSPQQRLAIKNSKISN